MCFSALWLMNTLIWLVVLCAVVAILRIIVPWAFAQMGVSLDPLMRVINIIIGVVIFIAVVWFIYDLYVCSVHSARVR